MLLLDHSAVMGPAALRIERGPAFLSGLRVDLVLGFMQLAVIRPMRRAFRRLGRRRLLFIELPVRLVQRTVIPRLAHGPLSRHDKVLAVTIVDLPCSALRQIQVGRRFVRPSASAPSRVHAIAAACARCCSRRRLSASISRDSRSSSSSTSRCGAGPSPAPACACRRLAAASSTRARRSARSTGAAGSGFSWRVKLRGRAGIVDPRHLPGELAEIARRLGRDKQRDVLAVPGQRDIARWRCASAGCDRGRSDRACGPAPCRSCRHSRAGIGRTRRPA